MLIFWASLLFTKILQILLLLHEIIFFFYLLILQKLDIVQVEEICREIIISAENFDNNAEIIK